MRGRAERTAHRGGPLLDHRERHPGAQDLGGAGRRDGHHLPKHLHQPRGRHRLPQGHDGRAHRPLRGGHRQPAGHPGGLRGAARRRHRRRRAGHRAGGARPGGAAVLRHRRRRVPAVLRRCRGLGAGLRRPRGRAAGGHRELPALDLRRRPHRAQARCPRLRPVHRRARHPAAAAGRPHRARQDRVARPVHPRRHDGRRRLRHQPAAGRRDRRRRAAAEGRPERLGLLPQPRRQPEDLGNPADQPRLLKDVGRHRIRSAVVLHRRHRPRHRRRGGRHHGRPHPEPDDARGPVRLHRQEARAAVHALPRQGDLRHAAAVLGRHCGGGDAGHARAFPDGAITNPPMSTSTAASPR